MEEAGYEDRTIFKFLYEVARPLINEAKAADRNLITLLCPIFTCLPEKPIILKRRY
jgi:hypothetical protein